MIAFRYLFQAVNEEGGRARPGAGWAGVARELFAGVLRPLPIQRVSGLARPGAGWAGDTGSLRFALLDHLKIDGGKS